MSSKTLYVNSFLSWIATRFTWVNDNGTWTKTRATWENNAGTWRCIQAALSVEAQQATGSAQGFGASGPVNASMALPANPIDEVGTITYSWAVVSVSQGTEPGIVGAATSSPTWSTTVFDGTPAISTWRLTISDDVTGATATQTITVTLTWNDQS